MSIRVRSTAMSSDPPTDDVTLAAHPYTAARRFGVAVAILGLLVVVAWLSWSTVASRRLQREIDAVRARGEPITADDFPNPPLADADNAAVAWRAACAAVSAAMACPSSSNLAYQYCPPYPPAWWAAAKGSESANKAVFPLSDAAADLPRARWVAGTSAVTFSVLGEPPLNALRALCNVLGDSALYTHFTGDDDRCLARLHDGLRLAAAVNQVPNVSAHMTAVAIASTICTDIFAVAPDLDVGPPAGPRRERVTALIRELSVDPPLPDRLAPVFAQRAYLMDGRRQYRAGSPLLGPLADLAICRDFGELAAEVEAVRQPDEPAAMGVLAILPAAPQTTPRPSRIFDQRYANAPAYAHVEFLHRATRHAAAVALAIRLYRADHAGRWPADLAALAPTYLPVVPADPLAAGGPPVAFVVRANALPGGGNRWLLYVGPRGRNLQLAPLPPTPLQWGTRASSGQWFDLGRWTPAIPTSP